MQSSGVTIVDEAGLVAYFGPSKSANNAQRNRVVVVATRGLADGPITDARGTLVTIGSGDNNGHIQLFREFTDNTLWYRSYWSNTWGDWVRLVSFEEITTRTKTRPSLSLFRSVGVIGDSLSSGAFVVNERLADHYDFSWLQIAARDCGFVGTNFSFGGARTNSWLTNATYGLPKLQQESAKDLYVIFLITNDLYYQEDWQTYLGSIQDIHEDPTLNPDTFYGNYGRIVSAVKQKSQFAKIILFKSWNNAGRALNFNNAIAAIAEHFSIPCVSWLESDFISDSSFVEGFEQNHPTLVQYGGMADAARRIIENCMDENQDYFANTEGFV